MSGCPGTHPLPSASDSTSHLSSSFHLSTGYFRHSPARCVPPTLLDHNTRRSQHGPCLAINTAALPHLPCPLFRRPPPSPVSLGKITFRSDSPADKHRWNCRGTRWKIRGYIACRCSDELCQSAGRLVRFNMYDAVLEDRQHGKAKPRMWWGLHCAHHNQRS